MRAVELAADGIDATLQDLPIVTFYEAGFPDLQRVGEPVGLGYYVILGPPGRHAACSRRLNAAIVASLRDGSLREVLQRYKLWNDTQRQRALEADDAGNFAPGSMSASGAGRRDAGLCRGPRLGRDLATWSVAVGGGLDDD